MHTKALLFCVASLLAVNVMAAPTPAIEEPISPLFVRVSQEYSDIVEAAGVKLVRAANKLSDSGRMHGGKRAANKLSDSGRMHGGKRAANKLSDSGRMHGGKRAANKLSDSGRMHG